MNHKKIWTLAAIVALFCAPTLRAMDDNARLAAGNYAASLWPSIDAATARQIVTELKKIPEIDSVQVDPKDSTVHFTVKKGKELDFVRVSDAVKKASPGESITTPAMIPTERPSDTLGTPYNSPNGTSIPTNNRTNGPVGTPPDNSPTGPVGTPPRETSNPTPP